MVLDPFGILFGRFGWHANSAQQIDHQAMAQFYPGGQRLAGFGQKHAAIRP